jgi:hypothetical protein
MHLSNRVEVYKSTSTLPLEDWSRYVSGGVLAENIIGTLLIVNDLISCETKRWEERERLNSTWILWSLWSLNCWRERSYLCHSWSSRHPLGLYIQNRKMPVHPMKPKHSQSYILSGRKRERWELIKSLIIKRFGCSDDGFHRVTNLRVAKYSLYTSTLFDIFSLFIPLKMYDCECLDELAFSYFVYR